MDILLRIAFEDPCEGLKRFVIVSMYKKEEAKIVGAGLKFRSYNVLLYREGKQRAMSNFKLPLGSFKTEVYTLDEIENDMKEWHRSVKSSFDHISSHMQIICHIIDCLEKKKNGKGYAFKNYHNGNIEFHCPYESFVSLLKTNGAKSISKKQNIAIIKY